MLAVSFAPFLIASMTTLSALGPRLATGGTAELYAFEPGRVLKLYWQGAALDAVEREAERTRVARAAGAPAPEVFDVVTIEQRPGVVFERSDGPSMLQTMTLDPAGAHALARELAQLHAALHARSGTGLPPQREHLVRRINLGPLPARNKTPVLNRLRGLAQAAALCHGDFHPGNVIMTAGGPRVIDWFDATCGNPAGDFARTCLMLQYSRFPAELDAAARQMAEALRESFLDAYIEHYRTLRPDTAAVLVDWFLPVAAARVAEPIPAQERTTLLRVIDSLLEQN
jgi:aminoglycoside phosphotransferase (APT) family kinase protein